MNANWPGNLGTRIATGNAIRTVTVTGSGIASGTGNGTENGSEIRNENGTGNETASVIVSGTEIGIVSRTGIEIVSGNGCRCVPTSFEIRTGCDFDCRNRNVDFDAMRCDFCESQFRWRPGTLRSRYGFYCERPVCDCAVMWCC